MASKKQVATGHKPAHRSLGDLCDDRAQCRLSSDAFKASVLAIQATNEADFSAKCAKQVHLALIGAQSHVENDLLRASLALLVSPGPHVPDWGGFLDPMDDLIALGFIPSEHHDALLAFAEKGGCAMPQLLALRERGALSETLSATAGPATQDGAPAAGRAATTRL